MTDTSREAVEAVAECASNNATAHFKGIPWERRITGSMLADCAATLRALLDERDKLLAENQRLRKVADEAWPYGDFDGGTENRLLAALIACEWPQP